MMRLALVLSTAALLGAQSRPLKTAPGAYPIHVQLDEVTLAAEYLVHSLPNAKATLFVNDYLVVEAAFFGPPLSRLIMSPANFTLRMNGKTGLLTPQSPALVAQSIKFPGLRPPLDTTVKNQENDIEYRIRNACLPDGEQTLPYSGLLYFYFRGNTKDIHSLDLLYDGPMGKSTLKLLR